MVAALRRAVLAAVIAAGLVIGLLAMSPGRLGAGAADGGGWLELPFTRAWSDGRPVLELILPALLRTGARVVPALIVTLAAARALALSEASAAGVARRAGIVLSTLPIFLLGYLVILGVNRTLAARIDAGAIPPPWFALPLGDGQPHGVKWGLEVLVLVIGDGALGLALQRLRSQVREISRRPYVLAGEINGVGGGRIIRRHLWAPLREVAVALVPLLLGGAVVVETMFQEPGAGRLLIERLAERDLPVVAAVVLSGIVSMTALRALVAPRDIDHRLSPRGGPR
jgi:peptide/nickel transport system permease protein